MTAQNKPRIYIIDASSLISLNRFNAEVFTVPDKVWTRLDELLEEGTLTSIRCVYDEIVTDSKKPDKISSWWKPKKNQFPRPTNQQVLYMGEAVNLFSGLVNPDSEKEQADAWLVAYAREKSEQDPEHEYIIVTQENKNSPIKIPAAAKKYNVKCVNLKEFFDEANIVLNS